MVRDYFSYHFDLIIKGGDLQVTKSAQAQWSLNL